MNHEISLYVALAFASFGAVAQTQNAEILRLAQNSKGTQLLVDGSPFIILGAQSGNTSASNLHDIEVVYRDLDAVHANSATIPISWNLLEPKPGQFEFHLVDGAIEGARRHHLKLKLLWFGTSKNGLMGFTPDWIKTDRTSYFRVRDAKGDEQYAISPFSTSALKADQRAFSALMSHIREFDQQDHTVIMMQVENEDCLYPEDRDYSAAANRAFAVQPVPARADELSRETSRRLDACIAERMEADRLPDNRKLDRGVWRPGARGIQRLGCFALCGQSGGGRKAQYAIPYYINVPLINTGSASQGRRLA